MDSKKRNSQKKRSAKKVLKRNGTGFVVSQLQKEGRRNLTQVPQTRMRILPDSIYTQLKYWTAIQFNNSVGGTPSFVRYRPTGAFDIDPLLGGTSTAGFAELSALYSTYRVTCSRIVVKATNPNSASPYQLMVWPTNADLGAAPSAATVIAGGMSPYAKSDLVPLLGGPLGVVSNAMSTEKMYGDKAVYTDHNFSSLVTTVPTNNWFWNVGSYSATNGSGICNATVQIEIGIEFFDRIMLNV
jgi:hypothetical protein